MYVYYLAAQEGLNQNQPNRLANPVGRELKSKSNLRLIILRKQKPLDHFPLFVPFSFLSLSLLYLICFYDSTILTIHPWINVYRSFLKVISKKRVIFLLFPWNNSMFQLHIFSKFNCKSFQKNKRWYITQYIIIVLFQFLIFLRFKSFQKNKCSYNTITRYIITVCFNYTFLYLNFSNLIANQSKRTNVDILQLHNILHILLLYVSILYIFIIKHFQFSITFFIQILLQRNTFQEIKC